MMKCKKTVDIFWGLTLFSEFIHNMEHFEPKISNFRYYLKMDHYGRDILKIVQLAQIPVIMVQEHGLYSRFIIKELTSNIEPIYSFLVLYDKGLIEIAYFYNSQSEKSFEPQKT